MADRVTIFIAIQRAISSISSLNRKQSPVGSFDDIKLEELEN